MERSVTKKVQWGIVALSGLLLAAAAHAQAPSAVRGELLTSTPRTQATVLMADSSPHGTGIAKERDYVLYSDDLRSRPNAGKRKRTFHPLRLLRRLASAESEFGLQLSSLGIEKPALTEP